ncbi:MAG TPA: hypothetical protein ENN60_02900 [archaeon]|nr:hypothetical protein [archaeon]
MNLRDYVEFSFDRMLPFTFGFAVLYAGLYIGVHEIFYPFFLLTFLYVSAQISMDFRSSPARLLKDYLTFMMFSSLALTVIIALFAGISLLSIFWAPAMFLVIFPSFLLMRLLPFPWIFTYRHRHLWKSTWKLSFQAQWKVLAVYATIFLCFEIFDIITGNPGLALLAFWGFLPGTLAIRRAITKGLHVFPSL